MKRLVIFGVLVGVVVAGLALTGKAEVYVGQPRPGTVPLQQVDHTDWQRLLQTYVSDDGLVDYRRWKASAADQQVLNDYLMRLSQGTTSVETSKAAKLAFWINAYNAVTVYGILREYPTVSIRDHTPLLGYNIWKHLQLYVDGVPHSLNHIEHGILRKLEEPRIHFGIVCASIGCPRLLNEAYMTEHVDEQLERNARDFFRRRQNFRYDNGQFQLSSILSWFAEDFGANRGAQLKAIARWLPTDDARQAAASGQGRVSYLRYDWNLNEQP